MNGKHNLPWKRKRSNSWCQNWEKHADKKNKEFGRAMEQ